jgi:uncharacterized protein (UPF0332 family)
VIVTARKLVNASSTKPRQADLKRAVSTAYYALFHAIAKDAADLLVGVGADRSEKAWEQVYRSLQHGDAKNACEGFRNLVPEPSFKLCAATFVTLQQKRHDADYAPNFRILRSEAIDLIDQAELAIANLRASPKHDRREFAVSLLMKKRR